MKKKIYLTLIGGLGNQLFQFACGSNLAHKLNTKLIIDTYSGFLMDKTYNRKPSLPKKLINNTANFKEVLILFFLKIIKKIFFRNKVFVNILNYLIIDETKTDKYIKDFYSVISKTNKNIYLIGFFQSESYFKDNKNKIVSKIMETKFKNNNIFKIKNKITSSSLMVGLRMYEEAPLKQKQMHGGIENFSFYNKSISYFKKKSKNGKVFLFTTFQDEKFIKRKIKYKIDYYNYDKKYNLNDFQTLIFFTNFKNFVISNSSLYWWAAYLSEMNKKVKVISSKKFINKDSIQNNWKT